MSYSPNGFGRNLPTGDVNAYLSSQATTKLAAGNFALNEASAMFAEPSRLSSSSPVK